MLLYELKSDFPKIWKKKYYIFTYLLFEWKNFLSNFLSNFTENFSWQEKSIFSNNTMVPNPVFRILEEYTSKKFSFRRKLDRLLVFCKKKKIEKILECLYGRLEACNFIKRRLQHRCFPVNFGNFLGTTILRTPTNSNLCWSFTFF